MLSANAADSKQVKIQLWDTPGDQRLKAMTQNFYNGAHAALVVYDVTDEKSLESAQLWIQDVRDKAPADCVIAIAGNKIDLIEEVVISKSKGSKFAENEGIDIFFETSAKENVGIKEIFEKLAITLDSTRCSVRDS